MKSLKNKLSISPLRSNSVQYVHTSSTFVDSEGKEMTSKLICYDLHRISQRNQSFECYLKLNYIICHSHVINKGRAIRVKVVLYYDKNLYTCKCGYDNMIFCLVFLLTEQLPSMIALLQGFTKQTLGHNTK